MAQIGRFDQLFAVESHLGQIVSGLWHGTTIETTAGGTGLTTYVAGDILYASAANVLSRRAIGTNNTVLTAQSGVPVWSTISGVGIVGGSGTLNKIPLWTPNGTTLGNSIMSQSGTTVTVGGTLAATTITITNPLVTTYGGTGLASWTAGDLPYYTTGTALSKLALGTTGYWLGAGASAPQYNAPTALTRTDDTNVTLTLGGAPTTALLTAASITVGWSGTLATSRGGTGAASFDAATLYSGGATVGTLPKIGAAHTLVDSLLSESGSVVTLNGRLSLVGGTIGRISSGTDDSDWTVSRYAANTTAAAIVLRKSYGAVGSGAYPIAFMSLGALVWQGWDEAIGDFVSPGGQSPAYIFAAAWNAWTASDHSTYLEFALTPVGTVTPVRVVYLQYDGTWAPSSGRGNVPDLGTTGLPWRTGYFGTSVISPIFSGPVLRSNSATDLLLQYNTTTGAHLGSNGFGINVPGVQARLDVYETTVLGGTLGNSQLIWQHRSVGGSGGNIIYNKHWSYRDATGTTWITWRLHDAISVDGSFVTPGTDTRCFWERDPYGDIQAWGTGATAYFTLTSTLATFAGDVNVASGKVYKVNSTQVVGARGAAVADATDAASVITQLNLWLARARIHGLIAT